MKSIEEKLVEIGGKVWEKGGHKRIYVNGDAALEAVFGLALGRYNSGAISSAFLCGEKISNSQARKIAFHRPYYDCVAGQWVDTGCDPLPAFAV